ncbi:Type II secretion system protein GspE N-terminal domain-containing protein [Candidatus Electronema halotolerans]
MKTDHHQNDACSGSSAAPVGLSKHEQLQCLAEQYGCPVVEYSEKISAPFLLVVHLDAVTQKQEGWLPLSVKDGRAKILTCRAPDEVANLARQRLDVEELDFVLTLPYDFVRVLEHSFDLNPDFPPEAGRTPLAQVRTYLAGRRSLLAHYRTLMAKSRTGLAWIRTALSFIAIALLFVRVFGMGDFILLELPLFLLGAWIGFDSLRRYLPARQVKSHLPVCTATVPTGGTTVLAAENQEDFPVFKRLPDVPTAADLRAGWTKLSPVMRRRFLASDRTDMAEERTVLACLRTQMAKVRTGLAFTRTGLAFFSLGFGLMRAFPASPWRAFDFCLMLAGVLMVLEGFFWYRKGRPAGDEGLASVERAGKAGTIWDIFFPHAQTCPDLRSGSAPLQPPPVRRSHAPGIWATTGLALERTVLADRRNVMARLRTIMARSRTGMAFIRTGLSIFLIGIAFLISFPAAAWVWHLFDLSLAVGGLALVVDGFYWTIPAERKRAELPYCFADLEIMLPDYGVPSRFWQKAVFYRAAD